MQMTQSDISTNILFKILSAVVNDTRRDAGCVDGEQVGSQSSCLSSCLSSLRSLTPQDWQGIYELSKAQGVTAVVFEKVKCWAKEVDLPKDLALRWLSSLISVERQQRMKLAACESFAEKLSEHGLKTLVLKGVAVSKYYPVPSQREFGDLDCFLYETGTDGSISFAGCYEKGNLILEKSGSRVEREHYKHSHIHYKALEVENHQFCLPIRGSKSNKELERHLRSLLNAEFAARSESDYLLLDTHLYCPPADFNALFLTAHALNHFLFESIKVRHLLDWALFLKAEHKNINWDSFWAWCDKMHYKRFVLCLNHICKTELGLQIDIPQPVEEGFEVEEISKKILGDVFNGDSLYSKNIGKWQMRRLLVESMYDFKMEIPRFV